MCQQGTWSPKQLGDPKVNEFREAQLERLSEAAKLAMGASGIVRALSARPAFFGVSQGCHIREGLPPSIYTSRFRVLVQIPNAGTGT